MWAAAQCPPSRGLQTDLGPGRAGEIRQRETGLAAGRAPGPAGPGPAGLPGGPSGAVPGAARRRKNARRLALRGARRTLLEPKTEPTGRVETGQERGTPSSAGLLQQSLQAQASPTLLWCRACLAQQKGGGGGAQSREGLVPHGLGPGRSSPTPGPCTHRAGLPPLSPLDQSTSGHCH